MRETVLTSKENYMNSLLLEENETKKLSRQYAEELGLARISISPAEAQLVKTLVRLHGTKKFVEIGTLTGLSAQYIFEALPDGGELWTLEKDPKHCEKSADVFSKLDQSKKKIHLVMGDARAELEKISTSGPFDGVFIDGNKAAYFDYLMWAEKNLRSGGLILGDNIFLSGSVWGDATTQKFSEKQIKIMQDFNKRLADPTLYESAIVPSYEGLFVAIKK
ncbi:methyltransferase [Bdellovibrio bacteriovorus]|uniref:Methyltransferase n=1 Tax=Bdellovibrio bacteriovorus TaxID=959 RepID=A0A150WC64_BDEBC|nr:class I SAM-dependent methyltransferase [Bdellovibrio bacteriovorus]KYG60523.1 methyltransferase [Bdellovibrio bacteriovorus]